MDEQQLEFWDALAVKVEMVRELEGRICAHLMGEEDFSEDVSAVLEDLVFHITTQFPVSEEPGYDEDAASALIELAQTVSEDFMSFFAATREMSAEDFSKVSMLRKALKESLEKIVKYSEDPAGASWGMAPTSVIEMLSSSPESESMRSLLSEAPSASSARTSAVVVVAPAAPPQKKLPSKPGGAPFGRTNATGLSRISVAEAEDSDGEKPAAPVQSSFANRGRVTAPASTQAPASPTTSSTNLRSLAPATSASARATWINPRAPRSTANGLVTSSDGPVLDQTAVASRFYHCSSYDKWRHRVLVHGGLRRDKPSRLCVPSLYALEAGENLELGIDPPTSWRVLETTGQMLPALCWHAAVFLDQSHWMIFGGKGSNNQMTNAAYILDLNLMVWSLLKSDSQVPEPRGGHSLLPMPDGESFILFGGMDTTGSKCFNDVHIFNRSTKKWHLQVTQNAPSGRFVHSAAILGNRMWLVGGLKGSLAKSSPCADLWCLNLVTWEWSQPRQAGNGPEPGTYVAVPLEGDAGSSLLVLGSKAFDDTRASFYILDSDGDVVTWMKGSFPPKYKPTVSEGHAVFALSSALLIVGGRPGSSDQPSIDVTVIPRDALPKEMILALSSSSVLPSPTASGSSSNVGSPMSSRKSVSSKKKQVNKKQNRLSQSAHAMRSSPALSRASATLGSRAGRKAKDMVSEVSEDEVLSPRSLGSRQTPTSPTASSPPSPRSGAVALDLMKEVESLKETVANLQVSFETELSMRLDAESKAQTHYNSARSFREAYLLLQRETAMLYQLALSEVSAPASREKLERRYEELRSVSAADVGMQDVTEPVETLSSGGDRNTVKLKTEKSSLLQRVQGAGGKKEKTLEHHVQCVERINSDLNKLLRPAKELPPGLLMEEAVVSPRSSGTAGMDSGIEGESVAASAAPASSAASSHERMNLKYSGGPSGLAALFTAPPEDIHSLWKDSVLAHEFCLYTQHNFPDLMANALFCRAVQRLIDATDDSRPALVEALVLDHLVEDSEFFIETLDEDIRMQIVNDSELLWLESPPPMAFWEDILIIVEDTLTVAFADYCMALQANDIRPHSSMKPRTGGHHQLVASAETQLMERLAEMDREEGANRDGSAEFLFKKVTSEMVATEINYVTDLKVTTTIFRRPLMGEKSAILPLEAFNIFANIEDVYALNRKFLTALQKEHGKPLASKNYGKVFLEFAPEFKRVYLTYAGRKTISRNTLTELSNNNKKFAAFLEECLQKPPCRHLELKSFLIKPVQRICKYPLLLRTMVDSIPKGYTDKASLIDAKKAMEDVVMALEDQLFVEDDKMKVLELEGALNWHRDPKLVLAVGDRAMLYDSILVGTEIPVGTNVNDALMKTMRNIHLYLLSDLLLLVEKVEKKGARRDILLHVLSVPYSVVVPITGKAAFQILSPQQENFKYVFRCASMEQKLIWVRVLTDAIQASRSAISMLDET